MIKRYYHTIGDTDPLRFRLVRNGSYMDLTDWTVRLTLTPIHKTTPKLIDAVALVNDADQVVNRGWTQYNWQPSDDNIPPAVYMGKLVATKGADVKTFPTNDNDNDYFTVRISAPV